MKLKTFKDICVLAYEQNDLRKELRAEAVKWIKEDIKEFGLFKDAISSQSRKWMKRFNLTEEDLI